MIDGINTYRHSGRLGYGIIVIPVVGIVAALLLGVTYAYADVYIPIAGYVSFILTLIFAAAVGYCVSKAAVIGSCRSTGFVHLMGFLVSLLALYTSWVAFTYALISRDAPAELEVSAARLFMAPAAVWKIVLLVNEAGWYSIRGGTPKGTVLWIFWTIEAVMVIGIVLAMSASGIGGRVFCERCGRWCRTVKDLVRLWVTTDANLLRRITGGDVRALADLPSAPGTLSPYLRVDANRCESCPDTATYQVCLVTHRRKKDGELEEETNELTGQQLLTPQELSQLDELAKRPPKLPEEEPSAGDSPTEEPPDVAPHVEDQEESATGE